MHPNPVFHDADRAANLAFARDRGFGVLAVCGPDGPLMSHIPFLLNPQGDAAELHLVRSNPIARMGAGPHAVRLAVSGPDSYVSPDWYGVDDQVPTWNYVAVHLTGTLERLPQEEMHAMLDRQSAAYERQLAPKPEWTTGKMTPDVLEKMMRMIVPFRMTITGIDGTWKLGQNKPDDVRARAADETARNGIGSEPAQIAALMAGVAKRRLANDA
ncbi:FMN-binding negative transcriptional regulator [Sulfitobacter sp. S190]|uniref:FMN-binding negative transcriptional regulator n=1 Tax=Sulfitobacter sp. S190 TaxID=2867022 RepID=UPI0021A6DB37|nr:FMN-binding negative transcriptional regulator [Sulfitobacter sp. S190]UWR22588.1 FMN-binding negative transcriptional regulator [Sulfitobacter sp. S190]